jgi:hypothetical protein
LGDAPASSMASSWLGCKVSLEDRKIEKMSETAIHGIEREREGGERRKSRVLSLVDDGSGCLIRCFSLYAIWCDNPMCLILIGGHKGVGLHQLLIEVILYIYREMLGVLLICSPGVLLTLYEK